MTITVVIPTLNEEAVLPRTLSLTAGLGFDELIVVDGGSHDRTREIVTALRVTRDAEPLTRHPSRVTVLPVGLHLVEEIPVLGQVSFSDYDSFRNASVPFLFLSSGRTPRYHQPSDLPDTLHYERMAATVKWLANLAERMDQDTATYEFQANRIEFADEVTALRPLVAQAAKWETRIPGTSTLSLWKLKQDDKWLEELDLTAPTPEALRRLERISIRLQCLLADFPLCFLI